MLQFLPEYEQTYMDMQKKAIKNNRHRITAVPIKYISYVNLCLGLDHDGHHLSGLNTGVQAAALGALAEVNRVASLEDILGLDVGIVKEGDGHFAGDDVVNHFEVCGSNISAAAGEEMRKAVNDGAAVNLCGVVQTGGANVEMAGSFVLNSFVSAGYFVRHGITSFQI